MFFSPFCRFCSLFRSVRLLTSALPLFTMLLRKHVSLGVLQSSPSLALLVASLFFSTFYFLVHHSSYTSPGFAHSRDDRLLRRQAIFWEAFSNDLDHFGPNCDPVQHPEDGGLDVFWNESDHRPRPAKLEMSASQRSCIRSAHIQFVDRLKQKRYDLPYNQKTRGIVTTAGGPYLGVALVSIRMLRITGSTLPVELFLSTHEEWDPQICGTILPALNAKCVVLQDIFEQPGLSQGSVKIDKYQYKIMSILFSSFEEVLFLDSDCFPVFDPNHLFDSDPFKSTGLILWPDFWFPSESPYFFEIAGIVDPPIYNHAATESGQILYSKSRHELSIMLASYYNYFGPDFYYPLQSQGAPGEGDKETFLWSAIALNAPFYKVSSKVKALGYTTKAGDWRGSAMLQSDPVQDMQLVKDYMFGQMPQRDTVRPFFIHANFPKFTPASIFEDTSFGATGPTRDSDGTYRRVWHGSAADSISCFGFDFERRLWEEIKDLACTYEDIIPDWQMKTGICANATVYWHDVFETGVSQPISNS